jgi:predicted dehydrogenase
MPESETRAAIRLGVLSTARINELMLPAARACAGLEVLAVASRDADRARRFAATHGIPRAYGSYDELLADEEIDAVYISLPNRLHVEWSERALRAGKHVLCEKPLARTRQEAERAFDVAAESGRTLAEGFMYFHHPQTSRVRSLVSSGAVGRLRLIRAAQSFTIMAADDVRLSSELEGGALMDVGCYCVHFARFLAGEPERVYGEARLGADGVDLTFSGVMRFAGDVIAQFDAGLDVPRRDFLELVGTDGTIDVSAPWGEGEDPGIVITRGGRPQHLRSERVDPYRLQLEDFMSAIRGERAPRLGRGDAIAQAAAIEALYASAEHGEPVGLGSFSGAGAR